MTWLSQVGLSLTRLGNALLGGHAEESMSSRAWRAEGNERWWGRITRPIIDALFASIGKPQHCAGAYRYERNKPPLPVIMERD